jgi:hypothetical protein
MFEGTLIAASLWTGSTLDGLSLTLRKITRYAPAYICACMHSRKPARNRAHRIVLCAQRDPEPAEQAAP